LDETYERILKEIKKPNRSYARRVLQCLVVAIRPLRVAELAEVLAVDFDDVEGMPKLNPDWRWEDQEQALLIACSSLIAIVEAGDSRVVQFSHFSVKEFLTSSRLATAASNYYIDLEPAHTTLAQACLCVLLRTHHDADGHTPKDHPLAQYAAQHWTTHAQFEDVSSFLQNGMEYLFEPDKPHFEAWRTLYDIDTYPASATFYMFTETRKSAAAPLYYAALCGFHDLVEHLITKYPQDVNARGGHYVRPLVAALAREHFQTAELLHHNGADPHIQGFNMNTPLHSAAYYGDLEMVRKLIAYGADITAEDVRGRTPLYRASSERNFKCRPVVRLLLEHDADVNVRTKEGKTPLHVASTAGALEIIRLLLEHGADVKAEDNDGRTALQIAGGGRRDEVMKLLLEHEVK
jgi:ankyrin repeat protein